MEKMISMRVEQFGAPLQCTETDISAPKDHEVLLRVLATGVCHTDLHLHEGGYDLGLGRTMSLAERGVNLPLTMGHEIVGRVEQIGAAVQSIEPGQTYLIYPWLGCGECAICCEGRENYCQTPQTIGINRDGGYASHVIVPHARCLVPIGSLDPVKAAPLACSGLTAFSVLKKIGLERIREEVVVVFGAGGLGLMFLQLLQGIGGKGAVVIEPHAQRARAALQAGALAVIDPREVAVGEAVRQHLDQPVLSVVDFVGSSETAETAFDMLAKGGQLVCVGLYGGAANWPLPILAIKAVNIQGSYVGSLPELKELVELVQAHDLELIPVNTCSLGNAQQALDKLAQGQVIGRIVLTP